MRNLSLGKFNMFYLFLMVEQVEGVLGKIGFYVAAQIHFINVFDFGDEKELIFVIFYLDL